ncbi:MAG: quaternary amine ABC transporter ATP-binding protein [Rhodospirillales bacterium]
MTDKAVAAHNLYKVFGSAPDEAIAACRDGLDKSEIYEKTGCVVAVRDVTFEVDKGEIFCVMGLSGSGKSTLIRCLNRLHSTTDGDISLAGEDVVNASKETMRQIRLKKAAMVFQHFALLPHMTVAENVAFGLKVRGMPTDERRAKALEALALVGLEQWADNRPDALSGGMQQRVGLARGLAVDPEILLMDEPFSALDPLIRKDMQDELIELQRQLGTTIVFITHDLHEALHLGDRIAIMKDGAFVQVGAPEEIVTRPADEYVSAFTGDVDRSRVLRAASVMRDAEPLVAGRDDVSSARERLGENGAACYLVDDAGKPQGLVDPGHLHQQDGGGDLTQLASADYPAVDRRAVLQDIFDKCARGLPVAVLGNDGTLLGAIHPHEVFAELRPPNNDTGDDAQPGDASGGRQQRAS